METGAGQKAGRAATLAEINKTHLMMAGYSAPEILALGDLDLLSKSKMRDLIRAKVLDAARQEFDRAGVRLKTFDETDENHS